MNEADKIVKNMRAYTNLAICLTQLVKIVNEGGAAKALTVVDTGEYSVARRQPTESMPKGGLYANGGVSFKLNQLVLELYIDLNSNLPYPLMCSTDHGEIFVLEQEHAASLTKEFIGYIGGEDSKAAQTTEESVALHVAHFDYNYSRALYDQVINVADLQCNEIGRRLVELLLISPLVGICWLKSGVPHSRLFKSH